MPWSNQSGNGGGPWRPSNPGPWGQGPSGPQGGGGPPDLEQMLRRGQDRLRQALPGGSFGGRGLAIGAALVVLGWLATGFYTVRPDEVGINLVFGRYVGKTAEGLRYNLPYPIGSVVKPRVTTVNKTEIGYRSTPTGRGGANRDVLEESLILTGDENIVDVDFDVQWQIDPARAENYVFNLQNPEGTIKSVAESAMREIVGRRNIQQILTTDRVAIEQEVLQLMQATLNSYGAGVVVRQVQLLKVDPPAQVIDAFRDVQAAQQDQSRLRNEAETYASRVVPEARGQAARVTQEAEAYRERSVAEATGNASRFSQVYEEYRKAPDVTRQRLFLETMERVFGGMDKVIIDNPGSRGGANGSAGGQGGVVPILPLDQLIRSRPAAAPGTAGLGAAQGATR